MKYPFSVILLIIISLISCKEDEPNSPQEEIPPEALVEISIGSGGGILETEDFKLTVPAGAFYSTMQLKLYEESETNPSGELGVSKFYCVEGIPENYTAPLDISIKYSSNLTGINYISVGVLDTVKMFDTSFVDIVYDLIEAKESGGILIA